MATKLSKEEIKEALKEMTVMEMADLVKELEEEFGVSASMPAMVAAGPAAATGGETTEAEQTEFSVVLVKAGSEKIKVIKEVRAITGLGLKEAKEFVEAGGKPVKEGVPKEEAEKIAEKLKAVGATVEIK